MVKMVPVPAHSQISQHLMNANFFDAFQFNLVCGKRTALEIYLDVIAKTPCWISFLMALRNRAAPMFGIKNLGSIDNINLSRPYNEYEVGDRVGIFTIHSMTDNEVILMDSDQHLDAKISVCKSSSESTNIVTVSTVVHVHNLLGRIYMFFVVPFHKRIVPSMLINSDMVPQQKAA